MTWFDPGFSTPEMSRVFSPESRVQAMCLFEAALAGASAEAGFVAAGAAAEIEEVCSTPPGSAESLLAAGWEAGTPVVVLLEKLRAGLSPEASAAIHLGATTQDVVDSALMLQIRAGSELLDAGLLRVVEALRSLAADHRETPMMGRTFLQSARPTTFGLRVALWLEPLTRHLEELRAATSDLPLQLGGPVGNRTGLGEHADAIVAGLAERVGLVVPVVPWHTDRTHLAGVVALVARAAASVAKIGADLAHLSQNAIGEVRMRPGASSSMAGKQNPIDAIRCVAASQVCSAAAHIVTAAPPHELERAVGSWHAEWFAVPVAFQTAAAAIEAIGAATASLEVDVGRMAANLGSAADPGMIEAAGTLVDRVLVAADSVIDGRT